VRPYCGRKLAEFNPQYCQKKKKKKKKNSWRKSFGKGNCWETSTLSWAFSLGILLSSYCEDPGKIPSCCGRKRGKVTFAKHLYPAP
jgi:hypothetical protein